MELRTHLGQDRFFWMKNEMTRSDLAPLLIEVQAPPVPTRAAHTPTHLVVVLDRSGSMAGSRLEHAKRALRDVVDQLSPTDSFGLVTFDNEVDVPVPAGPVRDRAAIKRTIDGIQPGGSTDLGAGLLIGLRKAQRLESPEGVRVLLVSDGHANIGVTDPEVLGGHVGQFVERRITTSTLGMGLGYDEALLSVIALSGGGNEHFAEEADTAAGVIAEECGDLLAQQFLACRLSVTLGSGMAAVEVLNEATMRRTPLGVDIELGGLRPEERRSLVLMFKPHPASRPGRRKLAVVRLDYVLADDLSDRSVSTSVWARVARDEERPAVVDHDVMGEVLFQRVQRRKRLGMKALNLGDTAEAERIFDAVIRLIKRSWTSLPRARRDELTAEIDFIEQMRHRVQLDGDLGASYASKAMSNHIALNSRARGRRQ